MVFTSALTELPALLCASIAAPNTVKKKVMGWCHIMEAIKMELDFARVGFIIVQRTELCCNTRYHSVKTDVHDTAKRS